jgi:hypothetical protein
MRHLGPSPAYSAMPFITRVGAVTVAMLGGRFVVYEGWGLAA